MIEFLAGDEALAQGAYEAGLQFAASYPGTPATEVLEYLAKLPDVDAQWSVNEKVAFEVALASAIAGKRSLYSSKHVGLNVAMDPLMTSAYTGVNAGFIVVISDDPGIHSSQNEQDTRIFSRVAKIPMLEPSSPLECYQYAPAAFKISEDFDTPVMIRLTTRVAHTKENIAVSGKRKAAQKEFRIDVPKYVMVPRNAYKKHIILEKKLARLRKYSNKTPLNSIELNKRSIGFITSGVSYLYVKETYPDASVLKLGMPYPFPDEKIREFASKVKKVFVIEELEPFLEEELQRLGVRAKAKSSSFRIGELRPESIPAIVAGKKKVEEEPTSRKPVLCPGCPHRGVFSVLRSLKLTVAGDIGCYTLGALPPLGALHSCLCMGTGVTFFDGFSRALGNNVVGVIGDSTFVHSGITGLVNAAYNRTKGVIIILDNSTTAMTGSQPHPATGLTARGEQTKKLVLEDLCRACGADFVDVIDPFKTAELKALVKQRLDGKALSVIIARYPCRLIDRTRAAAPKIDASKCKKCYQCLAVNCPAISRTEDGFIAIDAQTCTGCNVCVNACSFGALIKHQIRSQEP
ncbi:MAG TPA: indolepyruvate ferredoxin oxidoreductase subunit alpha [Candidatus Omnitrophota bacterium]|nr:indolepyruvate ferredoxin oxidoreductase subunit alpha [Candidatus Omnitrophota bacterium]HQJ15947.1 indolepyruvate ferredoxin oxidoreductase subunit alpha [Candidatus Omnitrophota bacterium]